MALIYLNILTVVPVRKSFEATCYTSVFSLVADGKEKTLPHQRLQTFSQCLIAFPRQMSMVLQLKVKTDVLQFRLGQLMVYSVFCNIYMCICLIESSDKVMRGGLAWQPSL